MTLVSRNQDGRGPEVEIGSGAAESIPVLIDVASPTLRAGLRSILQGDGLSIVQGRYSRPSVTVADLGRVQLAVPGTCIVVLDSVDPGAIREAVAQGAHGAVLRDDPPDFFRAAVHTVYGGNTWMSGPVYAILARHSSALPSLESVAGVTNLSCREREVTELLCGGFSNREIGAQLHIATATVKLHVSAILRKLGVHSRSNVVALLYGFRADLRRDGAHLTISSPQDMGGRSSLQQD